MMPPFLFALMSGGLALSSSVLISEFIAYRARTKIRAQIDEQIWIYADSANHARSRIFQPGDKASELQTVQFKTRVVDFILPHHAQIFELGKLPLYLALILGASAFCGLCSYFILNSLSASLVLAVIAGLASARFAAERLMGDHMDVVLKNLPYVIDALIRCLRSGLDLSRSLTIVTRDSPPELRREFQRVIRARDLGQSLGDAMFIMAERIPYPETLFFVTLIAVQEKSGGPLIEALASLSQILKDRERLRQKRLVASAEARMSATILGGLPVIVAGLLFMSNPSYRTVLLDTHAGVMFLVLGALLLGAGSFVMMRMIRLDRI